MWLFSLSTIIAHGSWKFPKRKNAISLKLLEKAMAPHSSTLAWKIPWMEEPGGLQSMGSLRVGHDWATSLSLFHFHALEKKMATHSSILAWRIPGTGEPGGLMSMGSGRVGQDWTTSLWIWILMERWRDLYELKTCFGVCSIALVIECGW